MEILTVNYADAYLRYSDKNQDELSIEYQMEEVTEFAEKNGIIIKKWYIDRAKSAKKVAGRDEFYNYIDTVRAGTSAPLLLVWRTNRAFRNAYESHIYRKLLRENNIKLLSATQQIDEDTSSGRLVTNILADIDQYKSEEIGDHVTAASRSLVKRNPAVYMGQLPIFGYKVEPWRDGDANRQIYAIHEPEAEIVKQIFNDFLNGKSIMQIAAWLNAAGYVTRRGKQWSYQTVNGLLKNDFYSGVRSYMVKSPDALIIPDGVPAIIDKQTFAAAQAHFRPKNDGAGGRPRRQRNGRIYPLTGKIYCKQCGGAMCGKGGRDYQYYICRGAEHSSFCKLKRLRKDGIEKFILQYIKTNFINADLKSEIVAAVYKKYEKMPGPVADKKTLLKQKDKIVNDLMQLAQMKLDGEIAPEVFVVMNKQKNDLLVEIEKQILFAVDAPEKLTIADIEKKIDQLIFDINETNADNGEAVKIIFDALVARVDVDNGGVVVALSLPLSYFSHKIKNGSPVITLCENIDMKRITPPRVAFDDWKRKK